MTRPHCKRLRWVEAHFAGRITPGDEVALRAHLGQHGDGCAICRDRYARELLLERLDPRRRDPQARLGLALGLSSPGPEQDAPQARTWGTRALAFAVGATACLLLVSSLLWRDGQPSGEAGFTARGRTDGGSRLTAELMIYRLRKGGRVAVAQSALGGDDALAFAYRNPAQHKYLLVFGVDEGGRVYWFYPSWQDATKNPAALAIRAGPDLHELPDGVRHTYKGKQLTIHAVFGSERLRVREVEARLTRARAAKRTAFATAGYEVVKRRFSLTEGRP